MSLLPETLGLAGYLVPIVIITVGYALFQTANNTAVMGDIETQQRGLISGMLNLARNLGLVTGASVLGAVFTFASRTSDFTTAGAEGVGAGMWTTFAVAAILIVIAIPIAVATYRRTLHNWPVAPAAES